MSIISTAVGRDFKKELQFSYSHNFEKKCFDIMYELIPDLVHAKSLRNMDNSGIDIYSFNTETNDIVLAFQCKGFELNKFEKSQFDQCKKSIATFKKSGYKVENYTLIINLFVEGTDRKELEKLLDELVSLGLAKKVMLLDINNYVKYVFKLIQNKINLSILIANNRFSRIYKDAMEQMFYLKSVPFELLDKSSKRKNPSKYIHNTSILPINKSKWFFIISEFGFGKTSLLLNIYEIFFKDDFIAIYLPINQFKSAELQFSSTISEKILSIIVDRDFDRSSTFDKLYIKGFLNILKTNDKLVLMFDGIDENSNLYVENTLKSFFNSIRDFKSVCLFTLRKEFWDERQGTIDFAIGKTRRFKDKLLLKDWSKLEILNYITSFKDSFTIDIDGLKRIDKFYKIVSSNNYSQFYGDIPKRPLFLEMLLRDLIENDLRLRNISQIFESYLLRKFQRDRDSIYSNSISSRPLNISGDIYKQVSRLFSVLEHVSYQMTIYDNFEIAQETLISEEKIEGDMKKHGVHEVIEILLNSVLVCYNERKIGVDLMLKFSHKSFQDFFLARYLASELKNIKIENSEIFNKRYPYEVLNFLRGLIDNNEDKVSKKNIEENIRTLKEKYKNKSSLIYFIEKTTPNNV